MNWKDLYKDRLVSAETAAKMVKSGEKVSLALRRSASNFMLALAERAPDLSGVTLVSNWFVDYPWFKPGMEESFTVKDCFVSRITREAIREKRNDWVATLTGVGCDKERQATRTPIYNYSDYSVAFVSPPDKDGICSFGPDIWWSPNSCATAKTVIAEVDSHLPWVCGDNIPASKINYFIDAPPLGGEIYHAPTPPPDEYEKLQVIGALAADLINDGDTIQIGTGSASEAVYEFLGAKNDLGVHSEIIDIATVNLLKKGVITGKQKNFHSGKVVGGGGSIALNSGSRSLMEFMDHNPIFEFRDVSWVCQIPNIAANANMVAVNTALTVDLLGQVNCSSIGPVPIGGPGGQVEFCIGAHYSRGGRSIHCMLSTALNGTKSRIIPMFETGSQIMIPMPYLDYLVTEYGSANLENKSRRERAEALISIAHPDFQPELRKAAKELFWP